MMHNWKPTEIHEHLVQCSKCKIFRLPTEYAYQKVWLDDEPESLLKSFSNYGYVFNSDLTKLIPHKKGLMPLSGGWNLRHGPCISG